MMNAKGKEKRKSFRKHFWDTCVKDVIDLEGSPFRTEADFSSAVSVMDKIGGWDECGQEDQIGARCVACGSTPKPVSATTKWIPSQMLSNGRVDTTEFHCAPRTPSFGRSHAWCNGRCYGIRLRPTSAVSCSTMASITSSSTTWSMWPLMDPSPLPSGETKNLQLGLKI